MVEHFLDTQGNSERSAPVIDAFSRIHPLRSDTVPNKVSNTGRFRRVEKCIHRHIRQRRTLVCRAAGWRSSMATVDRVPSIRKLVRQQSVSVSTALQAYQLLEGRGVIEARPKSGFYVRARRRTPAPEPEIFRPARRWRPAMASAGQRRAYSSRRCIGLSTLAVLAIRRSPNWPWPTF